MTNADGPEKSHPHLSHLRIDERELEAGGLN